ncbi:hypothetical protein FMN63_24925 [Stappia sp. BW2]|uniref:hypothetical protein n=1 Tax=Stappia sp. BW2 TaxID=2592622 RepID=UPI0011DED429|nr:hypothetical protein [Stappia sp. BW2]TYC65630.1 hypothetical protein FMN63_24925 [Stappia sp. BW2]
MSLDIGIIKLAKGDRLFRSLAEIIILNSCLYYSIVSVRNGKPPAIIPKRGFFCPSNQYDFCFKLPIHGPVECLVRNIDPVDLTISAECYDQNNDVDEYKVEVGELLMNIVSPIFSNYVERQTDWMNEKYSKNTNQWPSSLMNFARVIRNAVVHHGEICFRSPNSKGVSWRSLAYSPEDNGRKIYSEDMKIGDFIGLMLEIDIEMKKLGAPVL